MFAQQPDDEAPFSRFIRAEYLYGNPIPPTELFPETEPGKAYFLHLGRFYDTNDPEWAYRTGFTRTGLSLGFTDFGNPEQVGYAYTLMPFMEFNLFGTKRLKAHGGIGVSYFTEKYEPLKNPHNDAISTQYTWSFRLFLQASILRNEGFEWTIGAGYFHHSNGHTKLPNLGLNSLLASTTVQFNYRKNETISPTSLENEPTIPMSLKSESIPEKKNYKRTVQNYFSYRQGFGLNALSEEFNGKKLISTTHINFGKIYNRTYKFGVGFFYRNYDHYYDYIVNNEALIRELYPYFLENPKAYAKNYGVSFHAEILMNHIGIECNVGFNIYKPFYKIDKMVSSSYTYYIETPDGFVPIFEYGKLDGEYELKRSIATRLGLKYYLMPTKEMLKYNMFFSATINANAGQADFSEFSVGFVYRYNFKERADLPVE